MYTHVYMYYYARDNPFPVSSTKKWKPSLLFSFLIRNNPTQPHLTTHFQSWGSTRHIDRHIKTGVIFIRVRVWNNVFQIFAATKIGVDGTKWKKGTRHWRVLSIAGKRNTTGDAAVLNFQCTALSECGFRRLQEDSREKESATTTTKSKFYGLFKPA